ncbi:MAG: hypothetical protein CMN56_07255 [Sneathiella sp.]|nr:hypothetical protein [Sneathiella sp.]
MQSEFERSGIRLKSIAEMKSETERNSHFSHSIGEMFRQGGNIPPIWSRSRGANTALIGIAWTKEYQSLLVRSDAPIEKPEDLVGARLAVPTRVHEKIDFWRAMCLRGYQAALNKADLTFDDVELVTLPVEDHYIEQKKADGSKDPSLWSGKARAQRQTEETLAFIKGDVDVIYTSGALGVQLRDQIRARELINLGAWIGADRHINNQTPNVLTVDRDLAEKEPETVGTFIRALNLAADWAGKNEAAAVRSIANDVGCSEDWVIPSYGHDIFSNLKVGLEPDSIAAVRSQKDFLREYGFIENDFSVEDWIIDSPLKISMLER